jgi:hypothetical protein
MPVPRMGAPVLSAIVLWFVSGCGSTAPVEGSVTLDGQPLGNATVVFRPTGGGPEAGGLTDADGKFNLTGAQAQGVVPGEYTVTVSKKEYPPGMKPPGPKEMSFKLSAKMIEVVHKNYTMPDKTPVRIQVPRGGVKGLQIPLNKEGT